MIRLRLPLAIAHRVLIDFFRDRRSRVVLIVTPGILIILGRYMYSSPAAFDRTGGLMLGVFPALSMFLTGSTALVHERGEGTLEKVLTTPASRKDLVADDADSRVAHIPADRALRDIWHEPWDLR
jgi:ABC-2 type transport system permease protein